MIELTMLRMPPATIPITNRAGKNCLVDAGFLNFLFTNGLNKPYW